MIEYEELKTLQNTKHALQHKEKNAFLGLLK